MMATQAPPPPTTSATARSAINDSNWAVATQVTGEPAPAVAGTIQNMVVSGLSSSTTYYFAIEDGRRGAQLVSDLQQPQRHHRLWHGYLTERPERLRRLYRQ